MNSLLFALRPLANDFLSTIVFVVLIALKVDVTIAVAAGMAIGIGQFAYLLVRRRPIAPLQWMSIALVLVFGTASFLTHDARFVMAKPTIIYAIIGTVMLKPGWMLRYMPPIARGHAEDVMTIFGFIWAGLMFLTGAANLAMALAFTAYWPAFMAVFPMASKLVLFAIQYGATRTVVRRRVIAQRGALAAT
jgi:intracellular septation protein A